MTTPAPAMPENSVSLGGIHRNNVCFARDSLTNGTSSDHRRTACAEIINDGRKGYSLLRPIQKEVL